MRRLRYLTLMGLLGISLTAAEKKPIASWSFDPGLGRDEVRGFQKTVDGVAGQALRFDGQTTAVVRPAAGRSTRPSVGDGPSAGPPAGDGVRGGAGGGEPRRHPGGRAGRRGGRSKLG